MRKISIITTERCGEVQGAFENGKLIAAWSLNDANWQSEYFAELLSALGAEEVDPDNSDELEDILVADMGGDEEY